MPAIFKKIILQELVDFYKKKIKKISTTPDLDLQILVCKALNISKERYYLQRNQNLNQWKIFKIKRLIGKRLKNIPIAYILGKKEFFGLDFRVNPDVLIPRPDSELLVEKALSLVEKEKFEPSKSLIVDVGTGSGCLIISIAKNLAEKKINFLALDYSKKALKIVRKNLIFHKLENKIKLNRSNLLNKIEKRNCFKASQTIIITANLPYIDPDAYLKLSLEVKKEPKAALIAKNKGLFLIKKIINQIILLIQNYKNKNFFVFLEIDFSQKNRLKELLKFHSKYLKFRFHKDLTQKTRVVEIWSK
ncbi:MAG: peptide chain release factor N(5)-glutamine methyltransferase [Candidatus Moranbacteria bacterium]|nr:peptide chain release factor N(5)-glutamine methyltransferase [Candidatus Moranbacteria bacterium]